MKKIIRAINRFLAELSGYLLVLVLVAICISIILRNCDIAVFGILEISILVVVAVVFMGLGNCEEHKNHVRITALLLRLPLPYAFALQTFSNLLTFCIMLYTSWALGLNAWEAYLADDVIMSGDVALYTWPVRAIMAFCCLLYCMEIINSISDDYENYRHGQFTIQG